MDNAQKLLEDTVRITTRSMYSVVFFSMCINILMLAAPIYMLQIFDRVLSSRSLDTLFLLSLIIIVAILCLALLEAVRSNILVKIGRWIDKRLGSTLLLGSIVIPLKSGMDPSTQALRDLQTCRSFISGSEIFSFLDSPWAPVFLIFVFALHPWLGFAALTGAVVLFCLAFLNEYLTRPVLQAASKSNVDAMRQADSVVRNGDVIEAMGLMPNLIARWDRQNAEGISKQSEASIKSSMIVASSKFIRLLLQIGMLGTGAWLVILGELTPGAMIAASILMARALAPVEQAIGAWKSAISARDAYLRLKQHASLTPERSKSMDLPAPEGNLQVEGLTYLHPGQAEPCLKGINFKLQAGQALGVIGPSS